MKIDRREFLKRASAGGLMIPAWAWMSDAQAATAYTGKVLVDIYAFGGLDQSSWTDPRQTDKSLNSYAIDKTAIVAGNLRVAPMGNNGAFFTKHYSKMLVINGINTESNAHPDGARAQATGRLDLGFPHLDELYANKYGQGLPMPWMNGGTRSEAFAGSAGLLVPAAIPSSALFRSMLEPNFVSATQDNMKPADLQKGLAARAARLQAQKAQGTMAPRLSTIADQFLAADDARSLLSSVKSFLPATFDAAQFVAAQVGLIAAQAGITSAIQLGVGQFDSHVDHDARYATELPKLTSLIDYVWDKAAALGIANRIFMRIYSEFGRTPYNAGGGKDHLAGAGTMILMEAAPTWGNRVVGASGPRHQTLKINRTTGAVSATGVTITPRHIHQAIRKHLGITTTDPRFNLKVPAAEEIDFFNPSVHTGYPNI